MDFPQSLEIAQSSVQAEIPKMTSGIIQNPHASVCVPIIEGVQLRVALGSSAELGMRLRYVNSVFGLPSDSCRWRCGYGNRAGVVFPGRSDYAAF